MKPVLLFTVLALSLFACSPATVIENSWRDPNVTIQNPAVNKIVVCALLTDQGVRRQVEDYMVSIYPGKAVQSYIAIGPDSIPVNQDAYYSQKLASEGYDGMVIMKQINVTTTQHYIPGQAPSYYGNWGGYWGNGWGGGWGGWGGYGGWGGGIYNPGTPGYIQTNHNWNVEVNVYSLPKDSLIYSANTRTTNPGGRIPLFQDVCNAVKKQMQNEGFLK